MWWSPGINSGIQLLKSSYRNSVISIAIEEEPGRILLLFKKPIQKNEDWDLYGIWDDGRPNHNYTGLDQLAPSFSQQLYFSQLISPNSRRGLNPGQLQVPVSWLFS
jgi:hypothetical protein